MNINSILNCFVEARHAFRFHETWQTDTHAHAYVYTFTHARAYMYTFTETVSQCPVVGIPKFVFIKLPFTPFPLQRPDGQQEIFSILGAVGNEFRDSGASEQEATAALTQMAENIFKQVESMEYMQEISDDDDDDYF